MFDVSTKELQSFGRAAQILRILQNVSLAMSILCPARLYIGDDHGDNYATMRCQLLDGHEAPHRESYLSGSGRVVITWERDEWEEWRGPRTRENLVDDT